MTDRRLPDDIDERDEMAEEQEKQPKPAKIIAGNWVQWLHIAASLAAVTAITLLTLEMALGSIVLGKFLAYALGSSLLIGALFLLIIAYRYALSKIEPGLWRYAFWFISVPVAFLYYLIFIFLIFSVFAPLLIRIMGAAMSNAP